MLGFNADNFDNYTYNGTIREVSEVPAKDAETRSKSSEEGERNQTTLLPASGLEQTCCGLLQRLRSTHKDEPWSDFLTNLFKTSQSH